MNHIITAQHLEAFRAHLAEEERSAATVEKYLRDVRSLCAFLDGRPVTMESAAAWKEHLAAEGYAASSINAKVAAVNHFFASSGWQSLHIRPLRRQRQFFRDARRELTRAEYDRLVETALSTGRERLALLMEAVCATGVRVSEIRYFTVEAARRGRAEISMKGKIRTILLPGKLRRKLLHYAKRKNIASGEIFLTRGGTSLSRKQIWAEMKALCRRANIAPTKVFPHNLRHLFARTFYKVCRDVAKLADVLGHSSIETTRIYLVSTGEVFWANFPQKYWDCRNWRSYAQKNRANQTFFSIGSGFLCKNCRNHNIDLSKGPDIC